MLISQNDPIIIPFMVSVLLYSIDHRISEFICANCHSLGVIPSFPVDLQCIQNRGNYRHSWWCLTYTLIKKSCRYISIYLKTYFTCLPMYCTNFYDLPLLHEGGVICSIHPFRVPSAECSHTFDAYKYSSQWPHWALVLFDRKRLVVHAVVLNIRTL